MLKYRFLLSRLQLIGNTPQIALPACSRKMEKQRMHKIAGLLLCCILNPLHAGQVYKCQAQNNKTSYQDTPCITGTQSVIKPAQSVPVQINKPTPTTSSATSSPFASSPPMVSAIPAATRARANPDLSATENCSVDNPNRDPEFCRPANLRNVYGLPIRPAPRPAKPAH